ncbi:MAG: hypothetical protein ACJ71K_15895 [Nitrososphaeraceae archaeon]
MIHRIPQITATNRPIQSVRNLLIDSKAPGALVVSILFETNNTSSSTRASAIILLQRFLR